MSDEQTESTASAERLNKESSVSTEFEPMSLGQFVALAAIVIGLLGAVLLWHWRKPASLIRSDFSPELVIIQLNDTYRIDALRNGEKGGLSRVATLIKQAQQQNKRVMVVHAGDFIAPSLESNFFQGQQMIAALNYLDSLAPLYVVPGNHEFDDSSATTVVNAIRSSNFHWLASNLALTSDNGEALTDDDAQAGCSEGAEVNGRVAKCAIISAGKLKLGIFALTLHGAQKDGDQKYAQVAIEERYQLSDEVLAQLISEVPKEILQALGNLKGQVFTNHEDFIAALKRKISKDDKDFWPQVENNNSFWLSIRDDAKHWSLPGSKEQFLSDLQGKQEFWSSIADSASQSYAGPAEKAIQRLERAGANVIIGLTHLDIADDKQIARLRRNHPSFVWIAGGHEHYAQREGLRSDSALITKGDSNARSVWKVSIGLQENRPHIAEEKVEVNKDTLATDPLYQQQIADDYRAKLRQKMNYLDTVIGNVQEVRKDGNRCFIATEEVVRNEKSDWGTYLATQMRHAYPNQQAEIGVMNGGGIRIDDEFCDTVSYEQLERSIGFPTKVVYVKLKGSVIREMLEHSVGGKRGEGSFLQVSGIRFEFNRQKIPGLRVSTVQVQKGSGWTDLDPDKEHSVAVSEFLFNCRDGYVFRNEVRSYIPPGPDLRKLVLDSFIRAMPAKGANVLDEGVFEAPSYSRRANIATGTWEPLSKRCPS